MAEYVSPSEISRKYGFTARHWRKLACEGKIPGAVQPSGPGGAWKFDKRSFMRWWSSKEKKQDQWQVPISAEISGGGRFKETGRFTAEAFEQRLNRLQKAALGNG